MGKVSSCYKNTNREGRQIAQSVVHQTLEVEVRGLKPVLGTWWWGHIPSNQPYPKCAAAAATTHYLKSGDPQFLESGQYRVTKKFLDVSY